MTADFPYPIVSTEWLAAAIGAPGVKIVDATWRMPGSGRAHSDHVRRRIPGAVFFDLDAIADHATELPHMAPSQDDFARAVGALGIGADDRVILYDDTGVFSAARVWWTFRAMGHERASVLDGGLPKWVREGRAVEDGDTAPAVVIYAAKGARPIVRTHDDVRAALNDARAVVLDARPAARFSGDVAEPRTGLRRGHMPGAQSLPHSLLLRDDGVMRTPDELQQLFRARGVSHDTPVIASCGSGVTAAVIALALEIIGHNDTGLYDGSWAEWGRETNDPDLYRFATGADDQAN
ncbi:MAG: 3-mercaptopyruvate sulfurtransferase [Parvularculaceae bacterium]